MKKIAIVFLIILIASNYYAQDKGFGFGIMVGEPTGFSGKYWFNDTNALDFGVAYSFVRSVNALSLHADYLYHLFDVIKSNYRIPVYYGFGARLRLISGGDNSFGARGVIGLAWLSDKTPIDVFFELAPVFNLFPATSLNLDIALGARYYFN